MASSKQQLQDIEIKATTATDRDVGSGRVRLPPDWCAAAGITFRQPVFVHITSDAGTWSALCTAAPAAGPSADPGKASPASISAPQALADLSVVLPPQGAYLQQLSSVLQRPALTGQVRPITGSIANAAAIQLRVPEGLEHLPLIRYKLHQTLVVPGAHVRLSDDVSVQVLSVQAAASKATTTTTANRSHSASSSSSNSKQERASVYRITPATALQVSTAESQTERLVTESSNSTSLALDFAGVSGESTVSVSSAAVTPAATKASSKGSGTSSSDVKKGSTKKAAAAGDAASSQQPVAPASQELQLKQQQQQQGLEQGEGGSEEPSVKPKSKKSSTSTKAKSSKAPKASPKEECEQGAVAEAGSSSNSSSSAPVSSGDAAAATAAAGAPAAAEADEGAEAGSAAEPKPVKPKAKTKKSSGAKVSAVPSKFDLLSALGEDD